MIVEAIQREVQRACESESNLLTPAFYRQHVRVVASYAGVLATMLEADAEIVQLSAYLHDISAIVDFATLPTHPRDSATMGALMLRDQGYAEERIARVGEAILAHSQPLARDKASHEAVCLSNADAMAQIAVPVYWLFFAFSLRRLGFQDGVRWYTDLVEQKWEALIPEARALVQPEYRRALTVVQGWRGST